MEDNKKISEDLKEEITKTEENEKKPLKKEKKAKNNKIKANKIDRSALLGIIAVGVSLIGLVLAVIALVIAGGGNNDNPYGLQFYPDGSGNYIVAVGDAKFLDEIVIPDRYKGKNVIGIDDSGFAECENLKTIVIPDSIRTIGDYAFENCSSLVNVTMGKNVTSLGMHAFAGCTSLASIKLSDNLQNIGEYAFYNCSSLISISIPENVVDIGVNTFNECNNLGYNKYDNAYYLGTNSNPYHTLVKTVNTDITSCTIHPSTKVICSNAFKYCANITEIELPSKVVSIGVEAFMYCRNLKKVVMHESMYVINDRAFSSCESLTDVYYTGSEEQLYAIYVTSDNEVFFDANFFYNYNPNSN